jgi:hypothetical protein
MQKVVILSNRCIVTFNGCFADVVADDFIKGFNKRFGKDSARYLCGESEVKEGATVSPERGSVAPSFFET